MNQPVIPDIALNWLLQTHLTRNQNDKKVHLVPVSINYERMFEMRNLTTEMVSGTVPQLAPRHVVQKIRGFDKGALGKVYVLFGKPFTIEEYLADREISTLSVDNFEHASLILTSKLLKEQ